MYTGNFSLCFQGVWTEEQLTDHLQAIIAKHRRHFDGDTISAADVEKCLIVDSEQLYSTVVSKRPVSRSSFVLLT